MRLGFSSSQQPILLVVIDTEEEFDWNQPVDPDNTSVSAMAQIGVGQQVLDACGIRPVYATDYPVLAKPEGWEPLAAIVADDRCEIAAHLHAWVTPPQEELPSQFNSYASNLPVDLERRKLARLTELLGERLGANPVSYKAGRYGIREETLPMLQQLGYRVDLSTAPPFDCSADGGPDFTTASIFSEWLQPSGILRLPTTGAFVGFAGQAAPALYRAASGPFGMRFRLPGILARLGAVDRLRLSPEGFSLAEMKALTEFMLAKGERILTLSFHSPSLVPGHTPYVQSQADLSGFLDKLRAYFDYFFGNLDGITMTAAEVWQYFADQKQQSTQ